MMFSFVASSIDDKSLVLYLPFNEGKGTVAKDYSGNGNDGVIKGATKWVDGKIGKAVSFNDEDGYVEVEQYIPLDNRPYTIEAWIYRAKEQKEIWDMIVSQTEALAANKAIHLGMRRDNVATWGYYGLEVVSSFPIERERWYHIAGVHTGKVLQLFIDGKLEIEGAAAPYSGTKGNIFIGTRPEMEGAAAGTHGLQFDGIIDEVAIYQDKALSEDEINQDMKTLIKSAAVFPVEKLATAWGNIK